MDLRERFAENLKAARKSAGLTQEELARRCALHRTEISLLERAGRAPRLGTLVKLASALDSNLKWLCAGMAWDEDAQKLVVKPRPKLPPKRS
jgi:transcriptional regulator with XRE-family HTH domain